MRIYYVAMYIQADDMEELEEAANDPDLELPEAVAKLLETIFMWKEER